MRFRTQKEATEFIKAMLKAKIDGRREYLTAKLDSIPAWSGIPKDPDAPAWIPDGSEIEAVYLSYLPATEEQKEQAKPAKLAGVKLERISGRLVDVRMCADGTCQVLFVTAMRDAKGEPAFRGPNVDKGILCYLAVGEGLGEPVDDIIARVPKDLLDKLKAGKEAKVKGKKAKAKEPQLNSNIEPKPVRLKAEEPATVVPEPPRKITLNRGVVIDVPLIPGDKLPEAK
jgi:hypothetical protein